MSGTSPDRSFDNRSAARLPPLAAQLVRYGGVSAVAFLVDTGLLVVLTVVLGVGHLIAAALGFLAGLAVTAALSERYAFSGPRIVSPVLRQLAFALIGVVGLLLLWVSLWFLVDVHGLPLLPAKLLATVVVFGWNFLARRALFDNTAPPGTADEPADLARRRV